MSALRRFKPDLLALACLLALPLLLFWPVTVGGKTLIPADNLFQWPPWSAQADTYGVARPHNELLSDLLLENYAWKRFLTQSIQERQIPLWNPYLFAGTPFLATGQHSALYPFSLVFYLLPLPRAYGVFTVSQLFLAGALAYLLGRVLGMRRPGALLAGIVYQLCGFIIVSVDFPMILAGAAWLPFLLACVEWVVRQRPIAGRPASMPWVALGAVGLGMQVLAGHGENTYLTVLVMGLYAAWRLGVEALRPRAGETRQPAIGLRLRGLVRPAAWLALLVVLGIGLGSVQLIPFVELVRTSFREGAASLADVLGWAYPWRRLITLLAPNFFGNPSYHSYLDLFSWQRQAVTVNAYGNAIDKIDWGLKNYVEGGVYLGILPLLLAAGAVIASLRRRDGANRPTRLTVWFFALLAAAALTFVFPTGTYAIIHAIPIINQSHAPFRWVFPLSLCVSVLAGLGLSQLIGRAGRSDGPPWGRLLAGLATAGGLLGLVGLALSRLLYDRLEPVIERLFWGLTKAPEAFADARAFFSYEWLQLLVFSLMLLASGLILWLLSRRREGRWGALWPWLASALTAVDLALATWGFHAAADPGLLEVRPASIQFMSAQPGPWRLTTFAPHGDRPLHANTAWLVDLQDIRGYDSIISRQYVEYMQAIEPQGELLHNRIQPLTHWESLTSPLLDLLNVRFIVTAEAIDLPKLQLVWQGEGLRVYENLAAVPRAFLLPTSATLVTDEPLAAMTKVDPRSHVVVATADRPAAPDGLPAAPSPGQLVPAAIASYGGQEVLVEARPTVPSWLVLVDSYAPGWKAFIRPLAQPDADEAEVAIIRVDGNFRGLRLEPGAWQVRFKYSPLSFKVGLLLSFMAAMVIVFLGGVWLWRLVFRESAVDSTVRRVAKNSLAPVVLSVLNRMIDFALAMLTLRILGAADTGKYLVAITIAGWFEILGNFGLHTLLMREVAKDRSQANRYLVNTTLVRFATGLGAAVPIALYVLILGLGSNPLTSDTTKAIGLLMLGMVPAGINTGLTALYYAYEKAEIPAAFTTVTTVLRVSLSVVVLLLGMGFVGLSGVSIVVNLVTMTLLGAIAFRTFFVPRWEPDRALQGRMVGESFPLMINHLLATLFFKVDVLLLERIQGDRVVGWYRTGYMWMEALQIIPSFFTMALFPVISRQAEESREATLRTYLLAIKLMVIAALPFAVFFTFLADFLVGVLGGAEFLPHGARALQLMIWSIPIGWINSVTNYVLIALGRQRLLTRAFVVGLGFNLGANLIFLPRYSYPAAAIITILSELVLLIAFYHYLRPALATIPWVSLLWRPAAAGALMAAVTWAGWQVHWAVGLMGGITVYLGVLWTLKVLDPVEKAYLHDVLPARLKRSRP